MKRDRHKIIYNYETRDNLFHSNNELCRRIRIALKLYREICGITITLCQYKRYVVKKERFLLIILICIVGRHPKVA